MLLLVVVVADVDVVVDVVDVALQCFFVSKTRRMEW